MRYTNIIPELLIDLSFHPSILLSIHSFTHLSISLIIHSFAHLSLSFYLSVHFVQIPVHLYLSNRLSDRAFFIKGFKLCTCTNSLLTTPRTFLNIWCSVKKKDKHSSLFCRYAGAMKIFVAKSLMFIVQDNTVLTPSTIWPQ